MINLNDIQVTAARVLTYALWGHLPFFLLLGWLINADGMPATLGVAALIAAGPTFLLFTQSGSELHRFLVSAGMVLMAALLVFIFRGHPWQIDAHMYFFAALAILAALCDWRSIVVAAAVTAVHHLLFNFIVSSWIFPESANLVRVLFHAVVVVLETIALAWATKTLVSTFKAAEVSEKLAQDKANEALAEAEAASEATASAEEALQQMRSAEAEKRALEKQSESDLEEQRQRAAATRQKLAEEFEQSLSVSVGELSEVSGGLSTEVNALQAIARESSSAMNVAAGATENVSQNVNSVASSAEEMSASVAEISRQVAKSTSVVEQAREHAGVSEEKIKQLSDRADKINDVLSMIGEIAEQTNLLALNATIEAARAGDAGRGFAVVASEVKSLANQSANATQEIGELLAGIRRATDDAVEVNKTIVSVIGEIGENSNSIAVAVEEQSAATEEIARAAQMAAGETVEATSSVHNLKAMVTKVEEVSSVATNAVETLTGQTQSLSQKSEEFVVRIRA